MKHFFLSLCLTLSAMMIGLTASAQRAGTIQINSGDLTMSVDEKTTVSCTYSGKSSDVTWSSKDTKVVQVTASGLNAYLEAVGEGTTTVTASASSGWQNISSSITVTVKKGGGGNIPASELPFIPTTVKNGKLADNTHWYVMSIRSGKNIHAGEDVINCDFPEGDTPEYLWAFTGDLENGFKVYNYTTGGAAVLGVIPEASYDEYAPEGYKTYEGVYVRLYSSSEADARDCTWRLSDNSNGGLTFTLIDQTYAGINDHGGHGVLRIWDSKSNLHDNGAAIVITEVDPLDYGGTPVGDIVEIQSLTLDKSTLTLEAGATYQLTATLLPENATYKKVTWESSNPSVASVSATGLVTAKSGGKATITVTAHDGKTASVTVTVTINTNVDGLCFNEVQASNVDQYMDPSYNYGSWVEIYNGSDKAISLRGLFLTDDVSQPQQWGLSSLDLTYIDYSHVSSKYPPYEETSSTVPAKGFCKIWFDHNDWRYPMMCPFKLDQDGGSLYITDGSSVVAECDYPESITRASWARTTDGGDTWAWTGTPTPGESNNTSLVATQRLEAPVPDTDSKIMTGNGSFKLYVTWPEGSTLRYTLDGSTPTKDHGETSTDGRISINGTTIVRLCAVQDGMMSSPVVTRSFIYSQFNETLPVMSLVTEEGNLYDSQYGIMTRGSNGRPGLGQGSRCNWNMDWDRPANIEYFDKSGKMVFNQEANIAICGGWSRAHEPYSFKVKGKKQYEHKNKLPYAFYTAKPYIKNKTLHMRNGGNDNPSNGGTGRFKDPAIQTVILSSGLNIDGQSYEPIHLYRNGKYAGLINLREPNNRDLVYSNYGYDNTEVDQWEMDCDSAYVQSSGDREAFERWYDLAERCSDPAVYEELKQICDVEEFAYYMAVNCYLALGDYGYNNVKGYRPRVDHGKFRMVLFDLDSASSSSCKYSGLASVGNNRSWNNQYEGTDGQAGTSVKGEIEFFSIFGNMLENSAEFRKQFVDQMTILCGSVFEPTRCAAVIDSLLANVQEAAEIEGLYTGQSLYPESVAASLKSSYFSDSRINTAISGLTGFGMVRDETQGQRTTVNLTQTDSRGRLYLNGLVIPTGALNGRVFAPAVLRAEAPAGKVFAGWKALGGEEDKPESQTVFPMEDKDWYYYDRGSLDSENWVAKTYSDIEWQNGTAPLGYSKNVAITTETSRDVVTTYFRKYFNVKDDIQSATLSYKADDGFAVYVNGQEAGRYDLDKGANYGTYAQTYAGDFFSGEMEIDPSLFVKGSNVIAVEVHNSSATSSDIVWDAALSYVPQTEEGTPQEAHYVSTDPEYTLPEGSRMELQAVYTDIPATDEEATAKNYPVKLNEVSAANSIYVNDYYKKDDWVELYNTTDKDIDLTGYYLTDNVENLTKFRIDETDVKDGNILPAHGFRLVWCSKLSRIGKEIHANFKLANDEGAYVILSNPDQTWADTLTYQPMNGDETCGRYPDGTAGSYIMQIPTISLPNRLTMYADLYEQSIVGPGSEPDPVDPPVDPVGIRLISQSNELGINYSRGQINVTNEYFLPTTLRVYNTAGVEVLTADLDMSEGRAAQSTASLIPGTYVATATDTEGEKVSTKFNVK